jgi:hypothetical protein
MGTQLISGTLIGIRDGGSGPVIVIDIMGEYKKYPLVCEVSVDWAMTHMNNKVSCVLKDDQVTRVE